MLFELVCGDAARLGARPVQLGEALPTGWVVTAAQFEVEWPAEPRRARLVRSHFGARRKAFNWGLALVKSDLTRRGDDPAPESVQWDPGGAAQGVEPGQA